MDTCRSCGAPITWARTSKGKRIPLDPDPVENGNVVVTDDGLATVLSVERLANVTGPRFVSHFVTCPFARQHRRRR